MYERESKQNVNLWKYQWNGQMPSNNNKFLKRLDMNKYWGKKLNNKTRVVKMQKFNYVIKDAKNL